MEEERLIKIAEALSNPLRIKILRELSSSEMGISDLSRKLNISRPLLYMHLAKLEKAGLVETRIERLEHPPYVKKIVRAKKLKIEIRLPDFRVRLEEG